MVSAVGAMWVATPAALLLAAVLGIILRVRGLPRSVVTVTIHKLSGLAGAVGLGYLAWLVADNGASTLWLAGVVMCVVALAAAIATGGLVAAREGVARFVRAHAIAAYASLVIAAGVYWMAIGRVGPG